MTATRPVLHHHVTMRTSRVDEMVAWYASVLGAHVSGGFRLAKQHPGLSPLGACYEHQYAAPNSGRGNGPAIDDIFRASDRSCPRRGQEGHEVGNFVGFGRTADRNPAQ